MRTHNEFNLDIFASTCQALTRRLTEIQQWVEGADMTAETTAELGGLLTEVRARFGAAATAVSKGRDLTTTDGGGSWDEVRVWEKSVGDSLDALALMSRGTHGTT